MTPLVNLSSTSRVGLERRRVVGRRAALPPPVFVLTHHARDPVEEGGTTFTFVTDGIESALDQARAAAGEEVGLEATRVVESPAAAHLRYRVVRQRAN
jgi:hypothetical protein